MKEQPGNHQADPDDKAEQTDDIDGRQPGMPSAQSFRKFDASPIEKKVMTKK